MNEGQDHHEDDPVAEVRKWRTELLKEVGGTMEGLIALLPKPGEQRKPTGRAEKSKEQCRKSA